MGQGRRRVNKQAEVVIQINRGTKGRKRVVGEDTEIGSKPESQNYNIKQKHNKQGKTDTGRGSTNSKLKRLTNIGI